MTKTLNHPTLFLAVVLLLGVAAITTDYVLAGPLAQRRAAEARVGAAAAAPVSLLTSPGDGGPCFDYTPGRGYAFGPRDSRQSAVVYHCSDAVVVDVATYGPPEDPLHPYGPTLQTVRLTIPPSLAGLLAAELAR